MTNIEVRPANAEEMEEYGFVVNTALASHVRPHRDPTVEMRPEWTLCVFEDGELCTTSGAWPFSMRFNGERIAVAGVSAVGTLPSKRRRGFVRRLTLQAFRDQRDRGQSIAILYASLAAIYQRYGYSVAAAEYDYSIDPLDVRFASGPEPTGQVRITDSSELPLLKDLYRAFAEPRNGLVHRGEALWRAGPFADEESKDGPRYVAMYEEEGQALGWAIYTNREAEFHDPAERSQLLTVRDLGWLTPSAYVALWRHLGAHDLVRRIHVRNAPEDDPIFYLLEEPRRLRRRARDGIMLRVVDVERALPQRPYGATASLTFELFDEQCDWNQGVWELETDGRSGEVRRSRRVPQLRMSAHALGAMVNGYLAPTALARMGRLDVADHASLEEWDRAFATAYRPHCMNSF